MMQFSAMGFWGRGIYFANNPDYSYHYSYTPNKTMVAERKEQKNGNEVPPGKDEREMFLAKLQCGTETFMDRDISDAKAAECKRLIVPPFNPATGMKFNTVSGNTGNSQVWIVYENGRAYPDYLVRYYRGKRDPKRTPFADRASAGVGKTGVDLFSTVSAKSASAGSDGSARSLRNLANAAAPAPATPLPRTLPPPLPPSQPKSAGQWEYDEGSGVFQPYDPQANQALEAAYLHPGPGLQGSVVTMQLGSWTYEIDVRAMTQTNVEHQDRTQRKIRRVGP